MTWRQVGIGVLLMPVVAGTVLLVAVLVVCKLPAFCCERCRAVRWLPLAGLAYYGGAAGLAAASGAGWWEAALVVGLAAVAGNWLLPDPASFLLRPRRRRAVAWAIGRVEAGGGPRPIYGMAQVAGREGSRTVVAVPVHTWTRPPGCRYLAVAHDGQSIEELEPDQVGVIRGCPGWRWRGAAEPVAPPDRGRRTG
jgi:hypothetical protein